MSLRSGAAETPTEGAERLMRFGAPSPVREPATTRIASSFHPSCGSCTTVTREWIPDTAKRAEILAARGKPTTLVSGHGCDDCSTSIGVAGFGKSKTRTVMHGCTKQMMASTSCCK